jgi:hypothetical protein
MAASISISHPMISARLMVLTHLMLLDWAAD